MIDTLNLTTEELVEIYQNTGDEAVLEEIISRNMGLYHVWAMDWMDMRKYLYDIDDLVSEAMIVTWEVAKGYDSGKGYKFTTFLKNCIYQRYTRIYNYCTREKRGRDVVILGGVA